MYNTNGHMRKLDYEGRRYTVGYENKTDIPSYDRIPYILDTRDRPDLAFSINKLAQYCGNPTERHWKGVKRILRFVKGSIRVGLILGNREECGIPKVLVVGYFDAAYMDDTQDRHSTMEYIFIMVLKKAKSCSTDYNRGYERGCMAQVLSIGTGNLYARHTTYATKRR